MPAIDTSVLQEPDVDTLLNRAPQGQPGEGGKKAIDTSVLTEFSPEKTGFFGGLVKGAVEPVRQMVRVGGYETMSDDELAVELDRELARQQSTSMTGAGSVGTEIGGIVGGAVQAIGSGVAGAAVGGPIAPVTSVAGVMTSFAATGGPSAFLSAGTEALRQGKTRTEAVEIGRKAAKWGQAVGAATGALFPGSVSGTVTAMGAQRVFSKTLAKGIEEGIAQGMTRSEAEAFAVKLAADASKATADQLRKATTLLPLSAKEAVAMSVGEKVASVGVDVAKGTALGFSTSLVDAAIQEHLGVEPNVEGAFTEALKMGGVFGLFRAWHVIRAKADAIRPTNPKEANRLESEAAEQFEAAKARGAIPPEWGTGELTPEEQRMADLYVDLGDLRATIQSEASKIRQRDFLQAAAELDAEGKTEEAAAQRANAEKIAKAAKTIPERLAERTLAAPTGVGLGGPPFPLNAPRSPPAR